MADPSGWPATARRRKTSPQHNLSLQSLICLLCVLRLLRSQVSEGPLAAPEPVARLGSGAPWRPRQARWRAFW